MKGERDTKRVRIGSVPIYTSALCIADPAVIDAEWYTPRKGPCTGFVIWGSGAEEAAQILRKEQRNAFV